MITNTFGLLEVMANHASEPSPVTSLVLSCQPHRNQGWTQDRCGSAWYGYAWRVDANDEHAGHHGSEREAEIARKDREWAAKAESPAENPLGTLGTAAGAGSTGEAAGSGKPSSSQTYRTPKNLRTSSGPRFNGRGVLAVFGILGVLLTIGIMAFLAVKVLDGVSSQDGNGGDNTAENDDSDQPGDVDLVVPGVPGVPAVPVAPGVPDGAEIDPGGSTDAARAAECEAERDTIETAAAAYELLHGAPPSSVDEIVAEGYLRPEDGGFSHELSPQGTIVPTGDCAPG
jgi:hypothetical protein